MIQSPADRRLEQHHDRRHPTPSYWSARRAAAYVIAQQRQTGLPPTVREVGRAMGWDSTSTAQTHLRRAVDLGLLTHAENHASRPFRAPLAQGRCGACGHVLDEP
jgi:LexA DNA binding domain